MEEFIKKLIDRLEEEMSGHLNLYCDGLIKAMSVAKELAEEYSHCTLCYLQGPCEYQNENAEMPMEYWEKGWIPCEKELPKENGYYLVTYKKNGNLLVGYWFFNDIDFNQTEEVEVLYWQPLPAPYNPKGE